MFIEQTLDSKIKLIAEPIQTFRSVTVGIWVAAGSATESKNENGISHFIEHMMFKGTNKRSARQIAIDADNIGAQINAFTSKECTCYYIKMIDEKLLHGIEILADIFCDSLFDKYELEKEKGVVIEEIAMNNDNPEDVAMDLISSTFFKGCALEKTILGFADNIKSFERKDLLHYINRRYTANNIVIAVAGNFEPNYLIDTLNKYMSVKQGEPSYNSSNSCKGFSNIKGFADEFKDIEQVHICMGLKSYNLLSPKRFALQILNNIIGGSMSSRLFQKIREEMGMAYSVYSQPVMFRDTGMYYLYAGTMRQNAYKVADEMIKELKKIRQSGITKDEFEQSKQQYKGNLILSLENTSAKMSSIGKSMLLTEKVYSDNEILEMIQNVSFEDVRNVIDEIIRPHDITATYVGKIEDRSMLKSLTCDI